MIKIYILNAAATRGEINDHIQIRTNAEARLVQKTQNNKHKEPEKEI
jgi:hypothetical protein